MVYISFLTIVCCGDLWVNKVSISFLHQLDLKNEYKTYRYNYTDSALMG